jgi:hypothetical protein
MNDAAVFSGFSNEFQIGSDNFGESDKASVEGGDRNYYRSEGTKPNG